MGRRSNSVSPQPSSKAPSSNKIRMASRLPILLLLCLIPLLASALDDEEANNAVGASSADLQASVVKREAKECNGKRCRKGKSSRRKAQNGKKKEEKGKSSRRKTQNENKKGKKSPGKKPKSGRRKQDKMKKIPNKRRNQNKSKNKE